MTDDATSVTLLLFDIDGTLVRGATAAHRAALEQAISVVHGFAAEPGWAGVAPAGRTDGEIARAMLLRSGVSARQIDERAPEVREQCSRAYAELCERDLTRFVLPGIAKLLDWLDGRDEVRLGLVTGNYEPVARLKLTRAGIGRHFSSGQGAFGSDAEDRAALPAIARRRAGTAGAPHPRERTIVIGDTPRDIACARADGVGCIAVATGPFEQDALTGADAVASGADGLAELISARVGLSR